MCPEAAEVKIITEQLHRKYRGLLINNATPLSTGRYAKKPPEGFNLFISRISHNSPILIEKIDCKGKFIYWKFDDDFYLWNTLGMTGSWGNEWSWSSAFIFDFVKYEENLYFNDIRHFGTLKFVYDPTGDVLKEKLATLGKDLLSNPPNLQEFIVIIRQQKSYLTLPELLMNQKIFSGIGNYLKAEILYDAKLSPHRTVSSLSIQNLTDLHGSIAKILAQAYQNGGTTLANYQDINGQQGKNKEHLVCYKHRLDPNGHRIITEITKDKRTTYWCPTVQI